MPSSNDLIARFLRLRPEDISYVKFIFESYEVVGFLRTIDRHEAIIVVLIVPDFAEEAEGILASIEREIDVERVPGPSHLGEDWLVAEVWSDES